MHIIFVKILFMSKVCDFCNKGYLTVNNISHKQSGQWAKRAPKTRRMVYPNLRSIKLENSFVKKNICMKCYKKRDSLQ